MTNPTPDAPHTSDDAPVTVEGAPTEDVDTADVEERLDQDPDTVPNATDVRTGDDGVPDTDVDPMA